jgi:hypothetical protein
MEPPIPLFALDLAAATRIYEQMAALCVAHADAIAAFYAAKHGQAPRNPANAFAEDGWSPEAQRRADQRGRKSNENITIHWDYRAPALMDALTAAGLSADVLVQKHDWWPRDRYEQMSEAEQMDWDENALNIGFHLGGNRFAASSPLVAGRTSAQRPTRHTTKRSNRNGKSEAHREPHGAARLPLHPALPGR